MTAPVARDIIEGIRGRRINANPFNSVNIETYGAVRGGAKDATAAFNNAMADLGAIGGIIYFQGWYLIGSLIVATNVILRGVWDSPGHVVGENYTPNTVPSALVISPGGGITLGDKAIVENCLVLTADLGPGGAHAFPIGSGANAVAAVAAYSGTAFVPTPTNWESKLRNILVLGFTTLYDGVTGVVSLDRPVFERVYGDCTNGIWVSKVFNVGRAESCEMWPGFVTFTYSASGTASLHLRGGTAYYTTGNSTWMKWDDCFEYGWAIGHDVNASQDVRQLECGADSPTQATISHTNLGFRYQGAIANAMNIGGTATAQGDAGFYLNPDVQNNVNTVTLINPTAHGEGATNGYIHIAQGGASIISPILLGNTGTGAGVIHLEAGLAPGAVSIIAPIFGNTGSGTPIKGDATSIANTRVVNPVYIGTASSVQGVAPFLGGKVVVNNNAGNYTIPAAISYVGFTGTQAASVQFIFPAASNAIDGLKITIFTAAAVGTASTWISAGATFVSAPATLAAGSITAFEYDHLSLQWMPT